MRGKALRIGVMNATSRITPAYAGKSRSFFDVCCHCQDHPRLCGEKAENLDKRIRANGITPAYAGKSHRQADCWSDIRDHPRLCGEKCEIGKYGDGILGSPPPMRGKVVASAAGSAKLGITPAYAGKRQI